MPRTRSQSPREEGEVREEEVKIKCWSKVQSWEVPANRIRLPSLFNCLLIYVGIPKAIITWYV